MVRIMTLLLTTIEQFAIYNLGIIPSQFYGVLTSKPVRGFEALFVRSLLVIGMVVATKSLATFLCSRLSTIWRRMLSEHVHRKYFHDFSAYNVNHMAEFLIENP